MRLNRLAVMALSLGAFSACDTDILTSVEETTAALETAQSEFCTFREEAQACRATFDACVLVEGADVDACRTALHDCLPPPPPRPEGGRCHGGGDGGVRPPPPDGGLPPPGGPRGPGPGPGGPGGFSPRPELAAITACRDALAACLAASPGEVTCVETEHSCVRDAFRAAFDAACADASTACQSLPAEACTRLTERCAQGIDGRVDADGGICVTSPVVP
jgi:hypothetical protein